MPQRSNQLKSQIQSLIQKIMNDKKLMIASIIGTVGIVALIIMLAVALGSKGVSSPAPAPQNIAILSSNPEFVEHNGYTYFVEERPEGSEHPYCIRRISEDGDYYSELADVDEYLPINIFDNNIYYGNKRISLDGATVDTFLGGDICYIDEESKSFFYTTADTQELNVKNTDGSLDKHLCSWAYNEYGTPVNTALMFLNGNLYFQGSTSELGETAIYYVNVESGGISAIATANAEIPIERATITSMLYFDGYIYYVHGFNDGSHTNSFVGKLYRMKPDGSENNVIAELESEDYEINNRYIYFGNEDYLFGDDYSFKKRIRLDGSGYEDLTTSSGRMIGFDEKSIYRYAYQNEMYYIIKTDPDGKNEQNVIEPLPKPLQVNAVESDVANEENGLVRTTLDKAYIVGGYIYYKINVGFWSEIFAFSRPVNYSWYRVQTDGTGNQLIYKHTYYDLDTEQPSPETAPETEATTQPTAPTMSSSEIEKIFAPAQEIYSWFYYGFEDSSYYDDTDIINIDGMPYYRVTRFAGYSAFMSYIKMYFSSEIINDLMARNMFIQSGDQVFGMIYDGGPEGGVSCTYSLVSKDDIKIVYKVDVKNNYTGTVESKTFTQQYINGYWVFTNFEMFWQ